MTGGRAALEKAKAVRNDEFYTPRSEIDCELPYHDFTDKIVYCNCDGPDSEFVKYFSETGKCKKLIYSGINCPCSSSTGSFLDELDCFRQADVVVTNPPFSMMNQFMSFLLENRKDFLIIAPLTAVHRKMLAPYFASGYLHSGFCKKTNMKFVSEAGETRNIASLWLTTLPVTAQPWQGRVKFNAETAVFTDDGALFIKRSKDIPCDYSGIMAVPLSFLPHIDYNRFKIINSNANPSINGHDTFARIYMQNLNPNDTTCD